MKNFRTQVVIRVLLLTVTLVALAFLVVKTQLVASSLVVALLALVQVIGLIAWVEQTNRTLDRFFSAVRYDDFMTNSYPQGGGPTFAKLTRSLGEITRQFRTVRAEKEASYRYLERVVHHIDTAMISFEESGMVSFLNPAAKRLFQLPGLRHIEGLQVNFPELTTLLLDMKSGQKEVMNLNIGEEQVELAISMTDFKLSERGYRLFTFVDIQHELERKEVDAWQKLIRVLTHEIMNSVTPISTLAETMKGIMQGVAIADDGSLNAEATADVGQAVTIIERRSKGLLQFVESYRDLTRIPPPSYETIEVAPFLDDLGRLFQTQFEAEAIQFHLDCHPPEMMLTTDLQLLEQVLINLLVNAIQALDSQPDKQIDLEAVAAENGSVEIRVRDNGPGIPTEKREQIFIPFYSTKDEGMGVGLSISRQIVLALGGNIRVRSESGEGAEFIISLPSHD